ncbi:unnamed protein product [Diabrotica balteata]|uniref:Uncharacterized protein n=1 Tax=Diabrotica balteata TaxID=107213 RepID=A0A9N9T5V1_DIABA|nr:unnamed protein product [Diabrotica balteata]
MINNRMNNIIEPYENLVKDTAAPYVLYKDGIDRAQSQWGPQDAYPPPVQQSAVSGAGSPQQALGPTVPLGVEADTVPPRDQSLPSPAPSPYPATQAEPREDDIPSDQPTMDMEPRPASQCFSTELQQQQQQQAFLVSVVIRFCCWVDSCFCDEFFGVAKMLKIILMQLTAMRKIPFTLNSSDDDNSDESDDNL